MHESATSGFALVVVAIPSSTSLARPRYVSPSSKSMELKVYDKTHGKLLATRITNFGTASKNCKRTSTGLTCRELFAVPAGADTFDATLYDKLNATGTALSALSKFPQTIAVGKTSTLSMVLGGIAKKIAVVGTPSAGLSGSAAAGYTIVGIAPQTFTIVPQDADGNYIVGPGAPKVVWPVLPAGIDATLPKPGSNVFTVTGTYSASDPTVPAKAAIAVEVLPVANSGGTIVKTSVPLTVYQPWIYVMNYDATGKAAVTAYDERGNQKTLSGSWTGLTYALAGVYSPTNKQLYITNGDNVLVYDLMGNTVHTAGNFPNLAGPTQLAVDPVNSLLYVPNEDASGVGNVTAYDLQGNQKTLSGTAFNSITGGGEYAIAYESSTSALYAVNRYNGAMIVFDANANAIVSGSFSGSLTGSNAMTVDTSNGNLFVAYDSGSPNSVREFDAQGNAVGFDVNTKFWDADDPYGIAYDPYNDRLYVSSSPTVEEYDTKGNLTYPEPSFPNVNFPAGLIVVP